MNDLEMLRLEVLSILNQNVKQIIANVKLNSEQASSLQADVDKQRAIISGLDIKQLIVRRRQLRIENSILLNTANMLANAKDD